MAIGLALVNPWLLIEQGAPAQVHLTPMKLPPEGYSTLGEKPAGVLLEPPIAPAASGTQQHLIYQRYHGKTLLSGHALWVDRVRPDTWDTFVEANSFLRQLQRLERGELTDTLHFSAQDLQALIDRDLRWVSLNRSFFVFPLRDLVRSYRTVFDDLFGTPVIRDSGLWIWDTHKWTGRERVEIPPFTWPTGVTPGGPDQPVLGRRPKSTVFGVTTEDTKHYRPKQAPPPTKD